MMARRRDDEVFQPSLLDRLRDDRPRERVESSDVTHYGWHEYRDSVLRDIQWLLNTTNLAAIRDLAPWKDVSCSTLNFGVPELVGTAAAAVQQRNWELSFRDALVRFEPRLREESIRVQLCPADPARTANLVFVEISAELVVAPIRLRFQVSIDRETSVALVQESTGKGVAA